MERFVAVVRLIGGSACEPTLEEVAVGEESEEDVVYVLTRGRPDRSGSVEMMVARVDQDSNALVAYSTKESLVENCGPAQPWVCVDATGLDQLKLRSSSQVVLIDCRLPAELRQSAASHDEYDRPYGGQSVLRSAYDTYKPRP